MADTERGLYHKFQVTRTDGSSASGGKHENCRFFVLDLDHDRFAGKALAAYAMACKESHPNLALDLMLEVLRMEQKGEADHA